jgi:SEC-C motif-containing protein
MFPTAAAAAPTLPSFSPPVAESDSSPAVHSSADAEVRKAAREILDLLPKDVVNDLNAGEIDVRDPAFLDGLMDHVSRLALADPRNGQRILGKIIRLKKRIARELRESDPDVVVSATVSNDGPRTGRNEPCPCGSGRKYKQCCLRKVAREQEKT